MTPPATMPAVAAATASVAAPGTPACSNSGANASPVAGPPVSVTDPASTPISGCWPSIQATALPTTFWRAATTKAIRKKPKTSGPPRRSRARLAANPIEAKKVF